MIHEHNFIFNVQLAIFEDRPGLGMADITGTCECGAAIEFIGLEPGANLNGPACSVDNREARLAVHITKEPASLKHNSAKVTV